jgi:N-acetylglucosamine-6-phosphate deacetylase
MGNLFTTFTNCRLCINGQLVEGERLVVSQDTGQILKSTGYIGGEIIDLDDAIVAPGFLDICADGAHSNNVTNPVKPWGNAEYLETMSVLYMKRGVTGFWATIPFNQQSQQLLADLAPSDVPTGASLLGIHLDSTTQAEDAFEIALDTTLSANIKLATIDTLKPDLITNLTTRGIRVAMSSPTASYSESESALYAGATAISLPLSNTKPLAASDPGPVGLLALNDRLAPYYFLPCDNRSLHSRSATLLFRASPQRAILCSGNGANGEAAQVVGLEKCVRNIYYSSNCDIAQAVKAVTENVADFMGLDNRGRLAEGFRADFVVLDDGGNVRETWIAGKRVFPPEDEREGSPDY